ncbi:hypothetical protein C3Y87_17285 [Carbonactinospora thermoautotrophica]|uniref:hypothetical protein n=1 Tax=Carbonactinospora thermoautotrophica TaxID=1469144 RepID=UPI00226E7076|nr:hypothetical protein [Carbonactinospora thermoautotrophica]MCX9193135.1 hypothetical protein [Carbonactinospora thermoautotrophica]
MTSIQPSRAEYLKRYEPDDEGLRFQPLTYQGNFKDLEPVPDGILGDRMMRARMKTKVMEKVSREDVLKDEFTIDELNDLNNYLAWNIWDVLVMRATEGVSGMIPRQEYEILAFMQQFFRYPEFMRLITDTVGREGVLEIGASARKEIGTKINCVHDWCLGAVAFGMGRCGLLALEVIRPDDYVEESNIILKFMQRVLWGKRQDGYILNSQDRYRCQILDPDLIDRLVQQVVDFEEGSEDHQRFTAFNAAAELLAFFDHYDCRLGLGDTGPYPLPDGRLLLVRDLFVNEEIYHWSDVCEGLPYCYTLAVVIDPERIGLKEIRVNDISTTFTVPKNYIPAITGGAVFVREKWNTPMGEVYPLKLDELGPHMEKIRSATVKMYDKTSRMSRRVLCTNGIYSYYIDMILPHLRAAGLYEEVCRKYDFWEIDQRVSNYYYEITRRNFVQVTVPQKIFSGEGYLPFPDDADLRKSKYAWL